MTIAIGMRFDDGVLLATDTEVTQGDIKMSRSKIIERSFGNADAKCIFAIAGAVRYAVMAVDEIASKIDAYGISSYQEIREVIKSELLEMYRTHIWPNPQSTNGSYTFDLLIAVWTRIDGIHLLVSSEDVINDISSFECIGIGLTLGKYLLEPIFRSAKNHSDYSLVARYVIEEVKNTVPYCGKSTDVRILLTDGSSPTANPLNEKQQEEAIKSFWATARQMMILAADEKLSNEKLIEEFEEFREKVVASRQFLGWKITTGGQTCEPSQEIK